eukprot:756321-Hanusia_phi.AAC.1
MSRRLPELAGADDAREAEGADGLMPGRWIRGDVGHDQRLAVSGQAGLEEEGELGVPVGHVRELLGQREEDVG